MAADPSPIRRAAAVTGGLGGIGAGIAVTPTRRGSGIAVCDRPIPPGVIAIPAAGNMPFMAGAAIPGDGGMHVHQH